MSFPFPLLTLAFLMACTLNHCSYGIFIFPRPLPTGSSTSHGLYRRIRNGKNDPIKHSKHLNPQLEDYSKFEDVVAAVLRSLKIANSSLVPSPDLNETSLTSVKDLRRDAIKPDLLWKKASSSLSQHIKTVQPTDDIQLTTALSEQLYLEETNIATTAISFLLSHENSEYSISPGSGITSSTEILDTMTFNISTTENFLSSVETSTSPPISGNDVPSTMSSNVQLKSSTFAPKEMSVATQLSTESEQTSSQLSAETSNKLFSVEISQVDTNSTFSPPVLYNNPEDSQPTTVSHSNQHSDISYDQTSGPERYDSSHVVLSTRQPDILNETFNSFHRVKVPNHIKQFDGEKAQTSTTLTSVVEGNLSQLSGETRDITTETYNIAYSVTNTLPEKLGTSTLNPNVGVLMSNKTVSPILTDRHLSPGREKAPGGYETLKKTSETHDSITAIGSTINVHQISPESVANNRVLSSTNKETNNTLDVWKNPHQHNESLNGIVKHDSLLTLVNVTNGTQVPYSVAVTTLGDDENRGRPSASNTTSSNRISESTPTDTAFTFHMGKDNVNVSLPVSAFPVTSSTVASLPSSRPSLNKNNKSKTTPSSDVTRFPPPFFPRAKPTSFTLKPNPLESAETSNTSIKSLDSPLKTTPDLSRTKPSFISDYAVATSAKPLEQMPKAKNIPKTNSNAFDNNNTRSNSVLKDQANTRTLSTTTTTPYPPQNDVPWNIEHQNIPMSDSKGKNEIILKIKRYDDDPFIKPPEPFAEPGPRWKRAKKEWGIAWEVHIYVTGPLFALLAGYSAISIIRLSMLPNLHSKGYFISLNFMMLIMGVTRAVYLLHDSYNSNYTYPPILAYFIFNVSNPCLTSSFAILFLALLQATKLRLLSPRIQKPIVLAGIVTFHFCFSTATDIIVGSLLGTILLLFVCHLISLLWSMILTVGYFYIFRKLYKAALRKQGELIRITFTRLHIDGADLPKRLPKPRLGLAVRVTLATAILGFLMSLTQLYGMVCVFEYFTTDHPHPWPWWGFHFACRLLELAMCMTMAFIATQPMRHFEAEGNAVCGDAAWHPCSVFVGCGCARKDTMMAYSNSCLAHHSFRNPGFSSTLDTPRNWEQTNFQPTLQKAVTLERKDFSIVTDDEKSKNDSVQSLCSIKKAVINVDVDANEKSNSSPKLNENEVTSLARSTKSEKTSMLYKDNGFIRFRTDEDPEQPMELSDNEDGADDRYSTIATAGSVVHSIADEDQLQKAMSQFYCSSYWSPRAKRLSRASMDTTLESGMNTSVDYLNNLVFVRSGMSNSAQEFPMYRYGSTCSSESAGNSFDVYLHESVRSPRQNSAGNLNCLSKPVMKNNPGTTVHHRESFLSSSDNDAGDNNDLTSEDCATRSLLSHGDAEESSKDDETGFTSSCCQCQNDSNSSTSSCVEGKSMASACTNLKCCNNTVLRDSYLNSILPMVMSTPSDNSQSAALKSLPLENISHSTYQGSKCREGSCLKIDEDPSDGIPCEARDIATFSKRFGRQHSASNVTGEQINSEAKPARLYQKAPKSQSVDDLTKSSTYWDPISKSKRTSRTLWQKLRGSTFSLNTSFHGYEPLTTDDSSAEPEAARRSASDVIIQRSASDRRPQATSTVKGHLRSFGHLYTDDKKQSCNEEQLAHPNNQVHTKASFTTGNQSAVLILDSDRCSQISDVSV